MRALVMDEVGLRCEAGGFHVDPWGPAPTAVITHAHGDHAAAGAGRYIATAPTAALLRRRLGEIDVHVLEHGEPLDLGGVRISLHPAGHMLGSAQVRIEHAGRVWVVTGDYKRDPDPTCAPFEVVHCDVLVTEATFGLPIYRWPEPSSVIDELWALWGQARDDGVPLLLFGWALGKAQRICAELAARTDRPIHAHGAVATLCELYRDLGIAMPEVRSATEAPRRDLAGALVLAPPSARGTNWIRRFSKAHTAFASGWMRVRGERRRRAIDRGLVLSDHADWPALIRTVRESGAREVLVTHGHSEALARYLREKEGLTTSVLATRYEGEAGSDPS